MSNLPIPTTSPDDYYRQCIDMQPVFNSDLFQQLLQPENLHRAWRQVKANKGVTGIDSMIIDALLWVQQGGWQRCKFLLEQGEYNLSAARRVEIDKSDGGKRKLGIPNVIDRVIQQAIAQILTPLFAPFFSTNSFGFRPNRNAKQAVLQVIRDIIKLKRKFAFDVDLSKCFDRVNHDLLMTQLRKKVQNKRLLALIGKYLRAGVMVNDQFETSFEGVPQGSPLLPLLSNIMLDSLDKELESRGHKFARYADDFTSVVKSIRAGERVLKSITQYLATKLKLVINEQKSQVFKVGQSKFLGFTFSRGKIQWHTKTLHIFKQKMRRLTNRNWGVSMSYQLFKVRQYMQGWINYFGIANAYQGCVDLDRWIRRRVRMCYWRQWRSSKIPGIQQALSNEYFKKAGLCSLRDGWIAVYYPYKNV